MKTKFVLKHVLYFLGGEGGGGWLYLFVNDKPNVQDHRVMIYEIIVL